jgi:hypothetical protein
MRIRNRRAYTTVGGDQKAAGSIPWRGEDGRLAKRDNTMSWVAETSRRSFSGFLLLD